MGVSHVGAGSVNPPLEFIIADLPTVLDPAGFPIFYHKKGGGIGFSEGKSFQGLPEKG